MDITEVVAEHIKSELAELRELRKQVVDLRAQLAKLGPSADGVPPALARLGVRVRNFDGVGTDDAQDCGIFSGGTSQDADALFDDMDDKHRADAQQALDWDWTGPTGPSPWTPMQGQMTPVLLGDEDTEELKAALVEAEKSAGLPVPEGTFRGPDDDDDTGWAARTAGFGGNGANP